MANTNKEKIMSKKTIQDRVKDALRRELSNEELFFLLRFCEKKHEKSQHWIWKKRVQSLKNQIVVQNRGLVLNWFKRYASQVPDRDELMSDLNLAFVRSVPTFDLSRHCRWSTYVAASMSRAAWRIIKKNKKKKGREVLSLDSHKMDKIFEFAVDYEIPHPDLEVAKSLWKNNNLTSKENDILFHRYKRNPVMTSRDLAKRHGVSLQRIYQLEKRGLEKLKLTFNDRVDDKQSKKELLPA